MSPRSVACFSMPHDGHLRRLLPLVAGLARRGVTVHVFTHRRFDAAVRAAGGTFVDMFAAFPLEVADDATFPMAMRAVAYAARFTPEIECELAARRVGLVVVDTFAMIGRLAASRLALPWVNVCAGHNVTPERFIPMLAADPRVRISAQCLRAVERLRGEYGLADATPYSYVDGHSPFLNLYCEPPEYLSDSERQAFEPIAFFGSLPAGEESSASRRVGEGDIFSASRGALKVYVSFGTTIWRSYPSVGASALQAICSVLGSRADVRAIVSLGDAALPPESVRALEHSNITVQDYVDQWRTLQDADLFVTHHGLNSTHEAIYHRVPMLSYPFFWDQPALAAKCQALGVALPLNAALREPLNPERVRAAIAAVDAGRPTIEQHLDSARGYELAVMAGREPVIDQILSLALPSPACCGGRGGIRAAIRATAQRFHPPLGGESAPDRPQPEAGSGSS